MPIQPAGAKGVKGNIILDERYKEGLTDLEGFSYIWLAYHLHQSIGFKMIVTPFLDTTTHGVFATRAPKRSNSISISVVRLLKIQNS